MEQQKTINLLGDTPNRATKFRTKNWVEINDGSYGVYNFDIQIKFKTLMIRSSLYDQSDAYTLVKVTITVPNTGTAAALNNRNKKVIFKNFGLFTDCISEISNKEINHAKDIDVVMPRHNLIEYSEHYLKLSGSLWQYQRDEPFINDEDVEQDSIFNDASSFNFF